MAGGQAGGRAGGGHELLKRLQNLQSTRKQ